MWPFKRGPKEPFLDPTYGDPHRKALIKALSRRNWKSARMLFEMAADPDELAFLMEAAGQVCTSWSRSPTSNGGPTGGRRRTTRTSPPTRSAPN